MPALPLRPWALSRSQTGESYVSATADRVALDKTKATL